MISLPNTDGPTSNLVETYFRLAQATPGASLWTRGNLRGCTGSFDHPICNFAIASDLDEADSQEIARIAGDRSAFHVYTLPGRDRSGDEPRFARIGMRFVYRLIEMTAPPIHEVPSLSPVEAVGYDARLLLSRFMVGQFFATQAKPYREGIARATARAGGLDLYALGTNGELMGGVMLCRDPDTIGVYNLCVAPAFRNQGWGGALVHWARSRAGIEGRSITLQCDESLATWYRRSGFEKCGEISAYARSSIGTFDTM